MNKLTGPQKLIDALNALETPTQEESAPVKTHATKDKPKSSPYQYALYLLSGQDYSEFKLRQKLKTKGYEAAEIDEAVTKLVEKNYLREEEYKKLLVKKLMRKGKANSLIRRQVEQEHLEVNSSELDELREEIGVTQEETLTQLVRKKTRGQPWPTDRDERRKAQDKVYRYLLSRGYSYDEVKKALRLQASSDEI